MTKVGQGLAWASAALLAGVVLAAFGVVKLPMRLDLVAEVAIGLGILSISPLTK